MLQPQPIFTKTRLPMSTRKYPLWKANNYGKLSAELISDKAMDHTCACAAGSKRQLPRKVRPWM